MKLPVQALFLVCVLAFSASAQDRLPFDVWDRNGDGRLEPGELPAGVRSNFEKVDANGDGFISRQEDSSFRKGKANGASRTAPGRTYPKIRIRADLAYASTENPRQKLDLFFPKEPANDKPLPLIAFIHGGGWQNGDKRGGLRRVATLVESGQFVGASIGYRLSGEAIWPAQIHDCKAAIRWLRAHADEFGIDPDRIAVMGSSAGGHLVSILGTSGDISGLEGTLGKHTDVSSQVQCVIDEYGPTNFLTMNDFPGRMDHLAADSPESRLLGQQVTKVPNLVREASPVTYVSNDDPPFLIIHGTNDLLVPYQQSMVFAESLKQVGVSVILQRVENGEHGGFGSEEIHVRTRMFLEKHLMGRDVEIPTDPITVPPRTKR